MKDFYDIRNEFMYWLVRKLLTWGYPTWDYAYFMKLISDWTKVASAHFTKYDRHIGSEKNAKELLIVSEYADRLSNGRAWDEVMDKPLKNVLKAESNLEKEYMSAMMHIIKRKFRTWWY